MIGNRDSMGVPAEIAKYLRRASERRFGVHDPVRPKKRTPESGEALRVQLADIGPFPIERYKIERVKAASPATVNREIALLKHMFNLAEQ